MTHTMTLYGPYRPAGGPLRYINENYSAIDILAVLFILLLPLEGICRKWIFSGVEGAFGFIRDPIVVLLYIAHFSRPGGWSKPWVIPLAIFCSIYATYAIVFKLMSDLPAEILLLGLRSYLVYIPVAFILGDGLTFRGLRLVIKILLALSVPVSMLVFVQFLAPKAAFINKGITGEIDSRFTVAFNIVRPYGPFTFAQAQNIFAIFSVSIALVAWEYRNVFKFSMLFLLMGGGASFVMGALSGGRTFFAGALLVAIAYVISGFSLRDTRRGRQRLVALVIGVVGFLVVFIVVFPRSFQAMSERETQAQHYEGSTFSRAMTPFTDVVTPMAEAPFFGYGMGSGSNAARRITGAGEFIYGETEWGRIVNEIGPFFGSIFILARVIMTIWLGWLSFRINVKTGSGAALLIFGFVAPIVLVEQTTGQNQLLSFCWLGVGLLLAFVRLSRFEVA